MRTRLPMIVLLAAIVHLSGASRALSCPDNCSSMSGQAEFCTAAATLDTTLAHDPAYNCTDYRNVRWDMSAGTLSFGANSPWGGCEPRTTVQDDFTLLGLPAGAHVSLTARLDLLAIGSTTMGGGSVDARITEGASNAASRVWDILELNNPFPPVPHYATISVPVSATAGTPFHMMYWVGASLGELCGARVIGTFTFDGLPPGASIVSCKGFIEAATPVLPASWGSVKARYR